MSRAFAASAHSRIRLSGLSASTVSDSTGFDDLAKVGKEDGDTGELFPVPGEFTGKDGEELVEDGPGERERIFALDNLAYRLIAAPRPAG